MTQFETVGSMRLGSLTDLWIIRKADASRLRDATKCNTGLFTWWDPPSKNSAEFPFVCADLHTCLHAWINGTAVTDGPDCTSDHDALALTNGIDTPIYSQFQPLTLDLRIGSVFAEFDLAAVTNTNSEVPAKLTPLSGSEAARRLRQAWIQAKMHAPSPNTLRILTAHFSHETGGGTSMYNYNFGGIKGRSPAGLSCIREAHEGWGPRIQALLDRFRAYPNAEQGAADYLSLLIRLYPAAIEAAERGEVIEFVAALKSGGYFTGSEEVYAHALSELVEQPLEWGFDGFGANLNKGTATLSSVPIAVSEN